MKVRDILRLIEGDGWYFVRQRGSHRQFKHPVKAWTGDGCRQAGGRCGARNVKQHFKTVRTQMKKYLVVVEKTGTGYSAYSPDLPGCIATGATREEVEREMREAMQFHVEGLRLEGLTIPDPQSYPAFCEVAA